MAKILRYLQSSVMKISIQVDFKSCCQAWFQNKPIFPQINEKSGYVAKKEVHRTILKILAFLTSTHHTDFKNT